MKYETVTIEGKEHAIIPLKQLLALEEKAEMAGDVRDYDHAKSSAEEFFPLELLDRIHIDGVHPVRVFREHRGMTQEDLATKTGISRPYLTAIESGSRTGSLKILKKIAGILNISVENL